MKLPQDPARRFLLAALVAYMLFVVGWLCFYAGPDLKLPPHLFMWQVIGLIVVLVIYVLLIWREVVADRKEREGDA